MSNKLFVGNLSFNTTENDLNDLFAAHGTVTETNLIIPDSAIVFRFLAVAFVSTGTSHLLNTAFGNAHAVRQSDGPYEFVGGTLEDCGAAMEWINFSI